MTSPLRRSTRGSRNADATATSPEPSAMSPSASPTKLDRKRKRVDELDEQPAELHTSDQHASAAATTNAVNGHSDASVPSDKANGVTDDTASQDSSQKKQLPPNLQTLLGISSSRKTQAPERAKSAAESSSSKAAELVLLEEDATKLLAIADTLNVADLSATATAPQPDVKGKSRSAKASSTASHIRAILQPGTPLRDVRARLLSAREPLLSKPQVAQHLRTSQTATPPESLSTDLAHLSSLTLILGLVDQLASRLRDSHPHTDAIKAELLCADVETRARLLESKMAQTAKNGKAAATKTDRVHVRPSDRPLDVEATNRYALHMRLPRGDYFTKAIPLDRDQLEKLDPAQADIVQISAQSEEQMRTLKRQGHVPTPTLGQRLGRSGHRHRSESKRSMQPKLQPVTFLNYGNYASFAPSYDSSASSISYATSAALWRTSAKAHRSLLLAWGARPFQDEALLADDDDDDEEDAETSSEAIAAPAPHSGVAHVDAEGDVAMADSLEDDDVAAALRELLDGVDQGGVSESLHKLSEDELITSHLRFNMMLLHRLQEFQWARLRRSYGPGASSRKALAATEEESPSTDEEATAALLLESLSALVALQPRAVDLASDAVESLVPHASKLRAFSASSGAIDPDLLGDVRDGFWGALDANVVKSTRTSVVASETPLVLRDDVTVRLADGSGSKAKKTSRRIGPGGTQVEERGRGTLERFASSRTYDQSNDRHDVEPARTTGPPHATLARSPSKGDEAPSASQTPSQRPSHASPMSAHPHMHAAYGPGQAQGMTPQSQRLMPGPNASYAFASPSGGPNHLGRPVQYQQPAYAQSPSR